MCALVGLLVTSFDLEIREIPENQDGKCGISPEQRRVIKLEEPAAENSLAVTLMGTDRLKNVERVVIGIQNPHNRSITWYSSLDGGTSWNGIERDPCTSITQFSDLSLCLRSITAGDLCYRSDSGFHSSKAEVRRGNGKWTHIFPKMMNGEPIAFLRFFATSPHYASRVYAITARQKSKDFSLCVSDDYGRSFKKINGEIAYLAESRADPKILYGLKYSAKNRLVLVTSRDCGDNWVEKLAASITFSPMYRDRVTKEVRSWQESQNDDEVSSLVPVEQIDTDPTDPNVLYLLSFKGLYKSSDQGTSFIQLPLAQEQIMAISSIATSGAYLFACIHSREIVRSVDGGCHWTNVRLPVVK